MSEIIPISGAAFRGKLDGRVLSDIASGDKPRLFWIAIASLRVDHRYQRRIVGRASEKNVIQIATEFDWAKFAPVVVAEVEDGLFAIIDGQHRTTAAALRGIRDVPCLIHKADLAAQAHAFAAINGTVTQISTMQIHAARVAAGDPEALALKEACDAAGVTICRYPVKASDMKVGETLAAAKLASQFKRYGREVLVAALSCITQTGDGNIGFVRAPVVEALCAALESEPAWRADLPAFIEAMNGFDFSENYAAARLKASRERIGLAVPLIDLVCDHLDRTLGVPQ